MAFEKALAEGTLKTNPMKKMVAAISAGIVGGEPMVDLCYVEDKDAEVDCNIVMTADAELVEVQGSGEEAVFTRAQLDAMLGLAEGAVTKLVELQRAALEASRAPAAPGDLAALASLFSRK
jgi:ribonuclease PH